MDGMSRQHLAIRETSRGLRLTTLAVLAGLILVLGAWVGPGLAEGGMESAAPSPGLAAESGPGVALAGGEAYGEAIRTASGEDGLRVQSSQGPSSGAVGETVGRRTI